MGTWGEGNFESDDALEFLDVVIDDLVRTVRTCMTSMRQSNPHWFYSYYGEPRLMPAIDILIMLCRHYHYSLESLIRLEEVAAWRDTYLQIYGSVIHDYGADADYIADRRKVIEKTFDEFEEVTKDWLV